MEETKPPDLKWERPPPAADSAELRPSTTWLVEAMDGYRERTKSTGFKYPCNPGYAPEKWQGLMKLYRGVTCNSQDRDTAARALVSKMDRILGHKLELPLEQGPSRPNTAGTQEPGKTRSSQVPLRAPPSSSSRMVPAEWYRESNNATEGDNTVWKERSLADAWDAIQAAPAAVGMLEELTPTAAQRDQVWKGVDGPNPFLEPVYVKHPGPAGFYTPMGEPAGALDPAYRCTVCNGSKSGRWRKASTREMLIRMKRTERGLAVEGYGNTGYQCFTWQCIQCGKLVPVQLRKHAQAGDDGFERVWGQPPRPCSV